MAAAVAVVGGGSVVALWWPGSGPTVRWPGGDQLLSILGVALTALSAGLAYLTWRHPGGLRGASDNLIQQGLGDKGVGDRTTGEVGHIGLPLAAQLPPDTAVFTGRQAELAELLAGARDPRRAATVVITAIDGMGGIGKTALAVHAAHQLAAQYPDGQLFIDLKGFTDGERPVEPVDALERLLRAVGVSGQQVPPGLDERAALWRSVLTGQRMLVVLDNAATAEQVTHLLPGGPGCLVMVTSRRRLAGLPVATRDV